MCACAPAACQLAPGLQRLGPLTARRSYKHMLTAACTRWAQGVAEAPSPTPLQTQDRAPRPPIPQQTPRSFNAAKRCANHDAACAPALALAGAGNATVAAAAAAAAAPERLFVQAAPGSFQPYVPPSSPPSKYIAPDLYYFDGANYLPYINASAPPPPAPAAAAPPPVVTAPGLLRRLPLYSQPSPGMYARWVLPDGAPEVAPAGVPLYLRNATTGVFEPFDPASLEKAEEAAAAAAEGGAAASAAGAAPAPGAPAAGAAANATAGDATANAAAAAGPYGTPTPTPQLYTLDAASGRYLPFAADPSASFLPRRAAPPPPPAVMTRRPPSRSRSPTMLAPPWHPNRGSRLRVRGVAGSAGRACAR